MEFRDLSPLFNPRSIAIIGASADLSKVSGRPLRFLLDHKYNGKIYPVNPKYEEIAGFKCYKKIADLPVEIDLATIILPAKLVVKAVEECAVKGIRSVSIISSGFAELGPEGRRLQEQIGDIAIKKRIPVCGPNSVGVHNFETRMFASISQLFEQRDLCVGPIAFVSQSGAFGTAICALAQERKIGFTYFVSSGNEADLELADYVDYLIDDPKIKVISGYIEGIKDGRKFREVAEKAKDRGKPIVMIKVGRFGAGTRAASSHTGSMTGSDAVYDAVFKQTGILRAYDIIELLDYSSMLASTEIRAGQNVAIISTSGGAGVLMADKCEEVGLRVPELSSATKDELQKILPAFSAINNPVDTTGQFLTMPGAIKRSIQVLARDDEIDVIVIFLALVWKQWEQLARDISDVVRETDKLVAICWASAPRPALDLLARRGVVVYTEPVRCIKSVSALLNYGRMKKNLGAEVKKENDVRLESTSRKRVFDYLQKISQSGRGLLTENESKEILRAYDIPVTQEKVVESYEQALDFAEEIGWPVALKVSSVDIPHKSEAGALVLNIHDAKHLDKAFREVMKNALAFNPSAQIEGVLVQEMVPPGTETIIGISQDPQFGPVVMFGLGGIFVEIMGDVSLMSCPISSDDATTMIESIRGAPLLKGFRGRNEADVESIRDILLKVCRMGLDLQEYVSELDINPLIVFDKGGGAKAADALISLKS